MGRYDFLKDEETKKKLQERQKKMITEKKQEEVREGKKSKEEDEEEKTGPRVYTTESGEIGGVIYPEKESKKVSGKPSKQLMGKKEEENPEKGNPGDTDMPIKLRHTDKTKVGTEDRPNPPEKKEKTEEDTGKAEESDKKTEEVREEIWQ